MSKEEILKEFEDRFPCLVKPVGYKFTRDGKREEVEGMSYEKDRVYGFLMQSLDRIEAETKKQVTESIFNSIKESFEEWAGQSHYVTGAWNTGNEHPDRDSEYYSFVNKTAWEQFASILDKKAGTPIDKYGIQETEE